jgi:hypothetical protein
MKDENARVEHSSAKGGLGEKRTAHRGREITTEDLAKATDLLSRAADDLDEQGTATHPLANEIRAWLEAR